MSRGGRPECDDGVVCVECGDCNRLFWRRGEWVCTDCADALDALGEYMRP